MNTLGGGAYGAYAEARLHARFATLLPAAEWRRLQGVGHFAGFLERARDTTLLPWLVHFDPAIEVHALEAALRTAYARQVHAVAGWLPAPWRAAVRWVARLQELPLSRHLAAGGERYAWIPPDAQAAGSAAGGTVLQAWLARWRALWPRPLSAAESAGLGSLIRLWQAAASESAEAVVSEDSLDRLDAALRRGFRRTRAPGVLAIAYLGLLWLESARLRGALVRRRLLAATS